MNYSIIFRTRRRELGLTQQAVSDIEGLSQPGYARIETGRAMVCED
jgi:predicted transcriptional regulator